MFTKPLLCFLALPAFVLSAPARAGELDRENQTPTATQWAVNQTSAAITTTTGSGMRISDLEIGSTNPLRFDVSYVANSGSYAKAWWWYFDLDHAGLTEKIALHQARVIDLEAYEIDGVRRFAVVLVRNTGSEYKESWVLKDTNSANLQSFANNMNARAIDLDRYVINGTPYYLAVFIRNTGEDARAWDFHFNLSFAALSHNLTVTHSRLYDIERNENATFDAIAVVGEGEYCWWYQGISSATLNANIDKLGARLIDVERSFINNQWVYDAVLLTNVDPEATRVGELMRAESDGTPGVYLKRVNGSVLADLKSTRIIEPAGALKLLAHVHTMKLVEQNYEQLVNQMTVNTGLQNGSCPSGLAPTTRTIQSVLQRMMEQSSMADTAALVERFNLIGLALRIQQMGLADTLWVHSIGCTNEAEATPNRSTLRDLGQIQEMVATGFLSTQRDMFRTLMLQSLPSYGSGRLNAIIDAEAQSLGLPASVINAFKTNLALTWKEGSYSLQDGEYRAMTAWARIPFRIGTQIVAREFVSGAFVERGTSSGDATNAVRSGACEVLRAELRAALQTWDNYLPGAYLDAGPGCSGTNGVPTLSGISLPTINYSSILSLESAAPQQPYALVMGFSNTEYLGLMLPLGLDFLGATGCSLRVSLEFAQHSVTNHLGQSGILYTCPNDPQLVGHSIYTQAICIDPAANALGATVSNALQLRIGGWH